MECEQGELRINKRVLASATAKMEFPSTECVKLREEQFERDYQILSLDRLNYRCPSRKAKLDLWARGEILARDKNL